MSEEEKREEDRTAADKVLGAIDRVVPGFRGLFAKAEKSETFGPRIREIRKEIERKLGGSKK